MSASSDHSRLNLEFYRKRAKALLKEARDGAAPALSRLIAVARPGTPRNELALHHAQLAIAREQGFSSWPRFKHFVGHVALSPEEPLVLEFIERARHAPLQAERMLADRPGLARASLYAALVSGDTELVRQALAADPEWVRTTGGPLQWPPLAYVCFSRLARPGGSRREHVVAAARLLLDAGADPNTSTIHEQYPDNPLSCLYAASGLNGNAALAAVLLDAGANPNDGESLYHSTEHPDLACTRLLLERGATPAGSNALKHMLDGEHEEGVHLLLRHGADPNERNERDETALHWAVWRGRSAAIVTALLDAGAEIDARRKDGRTAFALAVRSGQRDIADLLVSRGASPELLPLDTFVAACADPDAPAPTSEAAAMAQTWEAAHLMTDLAMAHQTATIRGLLRAGTPVDARGAHGGTALHWACWKGYADLVQLLLDHGASLTIQDLQFHGTPPGWFGHGVRNCHERDGADYPGVARALVAAGATIPPQDLPTGDPAVDAVLREQGT